MGKSYVKEDFRKNKYSARAVTYLIQRISQPMDLEDRHYRSIKKMSEELNLPENTIRTFAKSEKESQYIYSKNGLLYLLKRPIKDVAITARLAEEITDDYDFMNYQEFTSDYQLVKRFKVSYSTVYELKKMQPLGVECKKTIYDEFKRKYYLTFYKWGNQC